MKKLCIVLLIALLPTLAFALDFQLGGTAMYKGEWADLKAGGFKSLGFDDFTFGGEARLSFGLLQGAAAVLYLPGAVSNSLGILTDVGVTLDLGLVRFGAGVGPNFIFPLGGSDVARAGINLKVPVDIQLGKLSLGAVGYWYFDKFSDLSIDNIKNTRLWLGLTLLYKLF